jgi:hypothetical protein
MVMALGCSTVPKTHMSTPVTILDFVPFPLVGTSEYVGAIIPAPFAAESFVDEWGPSEGFWTPTESEIAKIEAIIPLTLKRALEEPDELADLVGSNGKDFARQEIPKILANYSVYARQYAGIVVNGKRRIWCNFFDRRHVEQQPDGWRRSWLVVFDGGSSYWRIECEVDTGRCTDFNSNAYA